MKFLILIITLTLSQNVIADSSCFDNSSVQNLMAISAKFDKCFTGKENGCAFDEMTPKEQIIQNSKRLVPYDRKEGTLMDEATGAVTVKFGNYAGQDSGREYSASGQKISSCHVITSAHLLYQDPNFSMNSENMNVSFKSGQSCDSDEQFKKEAPAKVVFKMDRSTAVNGESPDYFCGQYGGDRKCITREFYGRTDLVIIKLAKGHYTKGDKHFTLDTSAPINEPQRVDCWGYPEYTENLRLPEAIANKLLWMQKGAQVFGDNDGQSVNGVRTNATSYKGMSGGGCIRPSNPTVLVGLMANDNKSSGKAAFKVTPADPAAKTANYLSPFNRLAKRYKELNKKDISTLESECE